HDLRVLPDIRPDELREVFRAHGERLEVERGGTGRSGQAAEADCAGGTKASVAGIRSIFSPLEGALYSNAANHGGAEVHTHNAMNQSAAVDPAIVFTGCEMIEAGATTLLA